MKGRKQHTLGSYIRTLRLQHEMTQASLANQLGVTDKAVSKWERDVSYPDMALFPRLADLLGVSVCDLLSECIEDQPSRLLQIYEMNHDIRTPLHIIIGYAHLAQLHQENPAMLKQDLENIRVTGEYLLQVIEQMMAITQQPAGYYDLVLMDIRMPVMDGFEATRRIRSLEDPQKAAIPVIALSANTFEKERRQAYEAGMNAFAEKPISLEKLFQTLEAYLK